MVTTSPSPTLDWSGTYDVLPSASTSSKKLHGDKIILPPSALEQLLAAAPALENGHSPYFGRSSAAYRDNVQLPNPLMFRLTNPRNDKVIFAGIREFSAPEGCIGLSSFLTEALGLDTQQQNAQTNGESPTDSTSGEQAYSSSQLAVRFQQLPKGTFVRLRPLEAGYNPDDWRPLLERQLRDSFTTLTRDSILSVDGVRGEQFKLLIDTLSPETNAVCVVDTDLEVDIEALNEEQARETLRQIASKAQTDPNAATSKGGEINIWKPVQGHVLPGDYVDYVLPSWNRSLPLRIVLSNLTGENTPDLFISPRSSGHRTKPRNDSHVFGNFEPAKDGSKSVCILPTNVELEGAESVLISVHAYTPPDETASQGQPWAFTLSVHAESGASDDSKQDTDVDLQSNPSGDEKCDNCLQYIPKQSMLLHQNFCRRNNIACPQCGSVFKRGSPEWDAHWHCEMDGKYGNTGRSRAKHWDIYHTDRRCTSCEFSTNSLPDLARHRTSDCPGKLILCRFCHLEVPQEGDPFNPSPEVILSGMTAHELADGARTTECHLCEKIIRLRDLELHLKHHELDKVHRDAPQICRNIYCGRTLMGVGPKGRIGTSSDTDKGPSNDLGLCSTCFGPLFVSMHDPEGKALRRRVERRYLSQLMTGCGKSYCRNEWCKTGRKNTGLEEQGTSAREALPLVKPLMATLGVNDAPTYFCVDEANQVRRTVAEMVAAEGIWELPWCVAAAEASKGDLSSMREWLQAWAPSR